MKHMNDLLHPVLEGMRSGIRTLEVSELWGASRALVLFQLFLESVRPLLAVTANEEEATALADDLRFFADTLASSGRGTPKPDILLFPPWGVLPFEADSPDSGTVGERMQVLYRLTTGGPCVVVAPVAALMQKLPPWELFADSVRTITIGQQMDPDVLADTLASTGYEHASTVTRVGEFSRRGGIIDFFSPAHEHPVRLELFGDSVESLRTFDPENQRSLGEIRQAVALPVRELIVTDEGIQKIERQFDGDADERASARLTVEQDGQNLSVVEQLKHGIAPAGAEFLAPFFYSMEDLFRYLPENTFCAMIEPDDIKKQADEWFGKVEQGRREEIADGRTLPEVSELYHDHDGVLAGVVKFPVVSIRLLGGEQPGLRLDTKSAAWLGVRLRPSLAAGRDASPPDHAEGTAGGLADKLKQL